MWVKAGLEYVLCNNAHRLEAHPSGMEPIPVTHASGKTCSERMLTYNLAAAAPGGVWGPASLVAAAGGAWSRCWVCGAARCWRCRLARAAAVAEGHAVLQGGHQRQAARGAGAATPAQRTTRLAQQIHHRCRWQACSATQLPDRFSVG